MFLIASRHVETELGTRDNSASKVTAWHVRGSQFDPEYHPEDQSLVLINSLAIFTIRQLVFTIRLLLQGAILLSTFMSTMETPVSNDRHQEKGKT